MSQESMTSFPGNSMLGWGNREWLDIINRILLRCKRGQLKTHVMYDCNLNSKQVEQYMNFLLVRNLLLKNPNPENPRSPIYLTTESGERLIASYEEMARIFFEASKNEDVMP